MLFLGLHSCSSFSFMNASHPNKKSFKYYDPSFKLDSSSKLEIDKKYIYYDSGWVSILIFYSDGYLNNYIISSAESISVNREGAALDRGYYKMVNDSLFFTTKSFYRKRSIKYSGLVYEDTLKLKVSYRRNEIPISENYVLYK